MLKKEWLAAVRPLANEKNRLLWEDYRVTVLGERLFRVEKNGEKIFRDCATQAIWYRDFSPVRYSVEISAEFLRLSTGVCTLVLPKVGGQGYVELGGKQIPLNNEGNLLGTYRTLDRCDGEMDLLSWDKPLTPKKIALGIGVCSKTGVAILDDSRSLSLGEDGQVKREVAAGEDSYVFAYGEDYRGAVKALYALTGNPPLVPRFALGNWWSRYHVYTDKEYLRSINAFAERKIPLSVATVDMDWHYSERVDEQMQITASGRNTPYYVGQCEVNLGWTGYTWNRELFPNPAVFLKTLKEKGLKITLNVHPSDGVRFWEESYEEMAKATGVNAQTKAQIPFDFSFDGFIFPYFELLHHPQESLGVDFWWLDWQQKKIPWHGQEEGGKTGVITQKGAKNANESAVQNEREEGYDPLWALNHYHYLDNACRSKTPLILSRYAGVGSHRYPVGFSGDTVISYDTLAYLPCFTATASNIGYTWWSHDIGGHTAGVKEDELYLRHVQYGVFSPIFRLHCTSAETMTKEPWTYGNGAGAIAEEFMRFRHKLLPYLYTASYRTHEEGRALVEPLYYAWKDSPAYEYKNEYLFGSELLVCPVVERRKKDGYARVKAWIPEGEWTDIFTGDRYTVKKGGEERTLYRTLESIPVLAKSGGILPLSTDEGNGARNPKNLEVWLYRGKGEYTLVEDGKEEGKEGELRTRFVASYTQTEGVCTQTIVITSVGDGKVIPKERILSLRFKNLPFGEIALYVDGKKIEVEEWLTDCPALRFPFFVGKTYHVVLSTQARTPLEEWKARAKGILLRGEGDNNQKHALYQAIMQVKTQKEGVTVVQRSALPAIVKARLKETL